MPETTEIEELKTALRELYEPHDQSNKKVEEYVGEFFDGEVAGNKITAKVIGNYGTYRVSVMLKNDKVDSGCSCYIGKYGGCHHSTALALTFLRNTGSFRVVKATTRKNVKSLTSLESYLKTTSLEALLQQLREKGITQSEFAESIGMAARHLSAVKSSETRNRFFFELGATKLACLWVLENIKAPPPKAPKKKAAKKRPTP